MTFRESPFHVKRVGKARKAKPEPAPEAGEPAIAEGTWHGWPPQRWDGAKWVDIEPAKILVEQEAELRRLRTENRKLWELRGVGVAFMVAADRASLLPVNPIAAERLQKLVAGTAVVVELPT